MWRVVCTLLTLQAVFGQPGQRNRQIAGRLNSDILFPSASRLNNSHLITTTAVPILTENSTSVRTEQTSLHEITASSDTQQFPFEIPLDEIRRLNEITDLSEFQSRFAPEIITRFGASFEDDPFTVKINAENPKPAKCEPEMTTVPLQSSDNSFALTFPSCTRVKRCGGCCNSELLSCQPTAMTLRNFQVYVSEYTNGRLLFNKKDVVVVEEHEKCKCDCKIKKEDCNVFQEYNQRDCRCKCMNQEDRQKCENDNVTKIWNYETCMCRCREVTHCSTGYIFDEQTCSCKPEPVLLTRLGSDSEPKRRRRPDGNRNRYGYVTSSQEQQHIPNRKSRSLQDDD